MWILKETLRAPCSPLLMWGRTHKWRVIIKMKFLSGFLQKCFTWSHFWAICPIDSFKADYMFTSKKWFKSQRLLIYYSYKNRKQNKLLLLTRHKHSNPIWSLLNGLIYSFYSNPLWYMKTCYESEGIVLEVVPNKQPETALSLISLLWKLQNQYIRLTVQLKRAQDPLSSARAGSPSSWTSASLQSFGCSGWSRCGTSATEGCERIVWANRETGRLHVRLRPDPRWTYFPLVLENVLTECPSAFLLILIPGFPDLTFDLHLLLRQVRILLPL